MTRHQYGISARVSKMSLRRETSDGVAVCRLFSQPSSGQARGDSRFQISDFREETKKKVPCQEKIFALTGLSLMEDPDIESLRFDRWPIVLRLFFNRVTLLA